ncbi:MAG: hypothetical protein JHC71_03120 [Blastococcus sp.]|nr:hypothetical protein [Blastococcus sp.]
MTITKRSLFMIGVGFAPAACGSDNQPSADVELPSATSASPSEEELVPNACGDETYRADHAEYCANVDPLPEGDADYLDTNDRGNVETALGQEIPLPDGGAVVLDAAEPVALPCPEDSEFSESVPQNGTFVRLDIRATTAPASATPTEGPFSQPSISSANFLMIKSDGVTFNSDMGTFPAYTCLSQNQMFPSGPLGPGQQFVGSIVLDVPDPAGVLVFFPAGGFSSPPGYEIQLAG